MSELIYSEKLKKYIVPGCPEKRPYPEGGRPGCGPTESELAYFTQEYLDFIERDDCYKVHQFTLSRYVNEDTMLEWAKIFAPLKDAIKRAHQLIGQRREIQAIQGKIDKTLVIRTMPLYDRHFRKIMKFESALKTREENAKKPQVIVMEKFPEVK